MSDWAYLRARPGRGFDAIDLVREMQGGPPAPKAAAQPSEGQVFDEGLKPCGAVLKDRVADRRYLADIEMQIEYWDNKVAEAEATGDPEEILIAREERDEFLEIAGSAIDHGGRSRTFRDDSVRARESVHKSIWRALHWIGSVHPALHAYLKRAVVLHAGISYKPESPIDWVV